MMAASGEVIVRDASNVEDCASKCSTRKDFKCQAFAYSPSACVLKKDHALIEKVNQTTEGEKGIFTLYTCKYYMTVVFLSPFSSCSYNEMNKKTEDTP